MASREPVRGTATWQPRGRGSMLAKPLVVAVFAAAALVASAGAGAEEQWRLRESEAMASVLRASGKTAGGVEAPPALRACLAARGGERPRDVGALFVLGNGTASEAVAGSDVALELRASEDALSTRRGLVCAAEFTVLLNSLSPPYWRVAGEVETHFDGTYTVHAELPRLAGRDWEVSITLEHLAFEHILPPVTRRKSWSRIGVGLHGSPFALTVSPAQTEPELMDAGNGTANATRVHRQLCLAGRHFSGAWHSTNTSFAKLTRAKWHSAACLGDLRWRPFRCHPGPASDCLRERRIVFVGDSTQAHLAHALCIHLGGLMGNYTTDMRLPDVQNPFAQCGGLQNGTRVEYYHAWGLRSKAVDFTFEKTFDEEWQPALDQMGKTLSSQDIVILNSASHDASFTDLDDFEASVRRLARTVATAQLGFKGGPQVFWRSARPVAYSALGREFPYGLPPYGNTLTNARLSLYSAIGLRAFRSEASSLKLAPIMELDDWDALRAAPELSREHDIRHYTMFANRPFVNALSDFLCLATRHSLSSPPRTQVCQSFGEQFQGKKPKRRKRSSRG
mmetsp:Transcript_3743/g.13276  ORF Transcript_3743/g.13276 Transcript_3743/m.13276 type:complete len:565 (+) Transcript_3743:44-1738(+)